MQIEALRRDLKNKHDLDKIPWRSVGKEYGLNGAMARLIANGREPGRKIRAALGLPLSTTIIVIGSGNIPEGAQAIGALQCACGQWFIANNPARKRCFLCSPSKSQAKQFAQAAEQGK